MLVKASFTSYAEGSIKDVTEDERDDEDEEDVTEDDKVEESIEYMSWLAAFMSSSLFDECVGDNGGDAKRDFMRMAAAMFDAFEELDGYDRSAVGYSSDG